MTVHTFELAYPECGYRILVPLHRPLYVLAPDALFNAQVYPAQLPQPGVTIEPLDFDAQECAITSARVALLVCVMLNFAYMLSVSIAHKATSNQLWWLIGLCYLVSALISLVIQQVVTLAGRKSRRHSRRSGGPTDKHTGSTAKMSTASMTTKTETKTDVNITVQPGYSGFTSHATPSHVTAFQLLILGFLAFFSIGCGITGHSFASHLLKDRLFIWIVWFVVYAFVSLFVSLLIFIALRFVLIKKIYHFVINTMDNCWFFSQNNRTYMPPPQPKCKETDLQMMDQKPALSWHVSLLHLLFDLIKSLQIGFFLLIYSDANE